MRDVISERYEQMRFLSLVRRVFDESPRPLDFEEAVQLALLIRRIEVKAKEAV